MRIIKTYDLFLNKAVKAIKVNGSEYFPNAVYILL
jgi:hypothetical protein